MTSEGYHEPLSRLANETVDMHRALASLIEELEAVDWYQQRVDATGDQALKRILAHNRDEEKEHASMVLEWLRRRDAHLDAQLRKYLFTEGDITAMEDHEAPLPQASEGSLGIGSLSPEEGKK